MAVNLFSLFVVGALSGFMTIIHVHSYIAFIIICGVMVIFRPRLWLPWFIFMTGAALVAWPLYQYFYAAGIESDFIRWYPGWLSHPEQKDINIIRFWLLNWGIFLPAAIFSIFQFRYYKNPLIVGAIIIFVLANLFLFQVYPQANDKLLIWTYLILCIPVSRLLIYLWTVKHPRILAQGLAMSLLITLSASGTLDLWRLLFTDAHTSQIWSSEDVALAAQFKQLSSSSDLVLTSSAHNHWIPTLTGRPIVLGFQGWLWTYGIKADSRANEVRIMFSGGERGDQLLSRYNVAYVVFDSQARAEYGGNEMYYESRYPLILSNSSYRVYAIK